jgi:cysteine desulfurase/selenocysteine lyase
MNTPDLERGPGDLQITKDGTGLSPGPGLPDVGLIAHWANAFFKASGYEPVASHGLVAATPASLSSPPTPMAAPSAPGAPVLAAFAPSQPPFGAIEAPVSNVPASSPGPLFGGASSSPTLPPAPFSQPTPPAFLQVAQPAPPSSPFAGEADFGALSRQFENALGLTNAAEPARTATPRLTESDAPPATASPQAAAPTPETIVPSHEALSLRAEQVPDLSGARRLFDAHAIKRDFPILQQRVHGKPLVWLDNGATTQKPRAVIDRLSRFYEEENSNIHRAAHTLAARATDAYEGARDKVRRFIGAGSPNDIVFVRGATEGVNLVAQSWGRRHVQEGDEIVITWLEHHANIVPWQQLAAERRATLRVAPVDDNGDLLLDEYEKLLNRRTRIVAISQVSNALGTITPVREMTAAAHRYGARVLVDGAQSVCHMPIDVQELDCDFFVFSGHKMFAPTGVGAVYGKPAALAESPPWQGGGNMIADVTFERTTYQNPPGRFEAGTGTIADAVGLGAAVDYLEAIGMSTISAYEHDLLVYAESALRAVPGLSIVGAPREKAAVISFTLKNCRSEDVGRALDRDGIAVRAGHHCAQPILRRFGLESTVRASLALYNTREDVDALASSLRRIAG